MKKSIWKGLYEDAEESNVFSLFRFNPEEVIGKKLLDVCIHDLGDYWEFELTFEGGKVIEIIRTQDNYIDIQTD